MFSREDEVVNLRLKVGNSGSECFRHGWRFLLTPVVTYFRRTFWFSFPEGAWIWPRDLDVPRPASPSLTCAFPPGLGRLPGGRGGAWHQPRETLQDTVKSCCFWKLRINKGGWQKRRLSDYGANCRKSQKSLHDSLVHPAFLLCIL